MILYSMLLSLFTAAILHLLSSPETACTGAFPPIFFRFALHSRRI